MPIFQYFSIAFLVLCVLQFFSPLLASKVKARFKALGYEMSAEPMGSLLRTTKFWKEARQQNKLIHDPVVTKLLLVQAVWLALIFVTFMGLIATHRG